VVVINAVIMPVMMIGARPRFKTDGTAENCGFFNARAERHRYGATGSAIPICVMLAAGIAIVTMAAAKTARHARLKTASRRRFADGRTNSVISRRCGFWRSASADRIGQMIRDAISGHPAFVLPID